MAHTHQQHDPAKLAAARAAVALVTDGMRVGLGTGSTASIMVQVLAECVHAQGMTLRVAATSQATADLAARLGLRVETLNQIGWLDLTIDGADEVDPDLSLIKGGGAAHLREKIVAMASDRMIVIADPGKVVEVLGAFKLPVEVLEFGWQTTQLLIRRGLQDLGYADIAITRRMRGDADGDADTGAVRTDEGNFVLDLAMEAIIDAHALAHTLTAIPGIVEHGLFLGVCDLAIIGRPDGTTVTMQRGDDGGEADDLFGEGG